MGSEVVGFLEELVKIYFCQIKMFMPLLDSLRVFTF